MVMDRAEQIGLGLTLGGHAAVIAAIFFLNGPEEEIIKEPGMAVTLVGEGTAPPVTGEFGDVPPPPAEDVVDEVSDEADIAADVADSKADEAAAAEAAAKKAKAAAASANATAAQKKAARDAAAKAAKKKKEAEAAKRARDKAAKEKARNDKAKRDKAARDKAAKEKARKDFEKAMEGKLGGNSKPSAAETAKARVTIGGQISIASCIPDGIDVRKISTRVIIKLNKNGTISSLSNITQKGRTASNAPQMEPTKQCVLSSIRRAAPFRGLDPKNYASWKSIPINFRPN